MILSVKNISKAFGALTAVDAVSFAVKPGETFSIVGESGCGKTTLAKMIMGLIRPDQGRVSAQTKIQMVFQNPYSSLDPLYKVRAILQEALHGQQIAAAKRETLLRQALESVGLEAAMLERFPHEFSGGQRQRLAIARALLTQAKVLVLDEPTSALDILVQKQILDLLSNLKAQQGLTYIFISHNLRVVKRFSDTIAVMRSGTIVEMGPAARIFAAPEHGYTRQLLAAGQYGTHIA